MSRLNIPIPEAYKERLRETSDKRGLSMAKAVRQAIALWIYTDEEVSMAKAAELEIELLREKKGDR